MNNSIIIDIQKASKGQRSPSAALLKQWCAAALKQQKIKHAELCIRIVDEKESAALNKQYRLKKGATNVLSFPSDTLPIPNPPLMGDLVVCSTVVHREAGEQHKTQKAHWAHMVVHGCLHLLGYDHQKNREAVEMEALEIKILKQLGFDNPYN